MGSVLVCTDKADVSTVCSRLAVLQPNRSADRLGWVCACCHLARTKQLGDDPVQGHCIPCPTPVLLPPAMLPPPVAMHMAYHMSAGMPRLPCMASCWLPSRKPDCAQAPAHMVAGAVPQ
jgi:hypothetical protein